MGTLAVVALGAAAAAVTGVAAFASSRKGGRGRAPRAAIGAGTLHSVDSSRPIAEVCESLVAACAAHAFGVLGSYDIRGKLAEKGFALPRESRVYEVCNPAQAHRVLTGRPDMVAALPCRIAVYQTEAGKTRLSTIRPTTFVEMFVAPELATVAQEVEETLVAIMAEAVR